MTLAETLFLFGGINVLCVRNAGAAPDLSGVKKAFEDFHVPLSSETVFY